MNEHRKNVLKQNLIYLAEMTRDCQDWLQDDNLDEIERELYNMQQNVEMCLKCFQEPKKLDTSTDSQG
jgi:hypothetical protein